MWVIYAFGSAFFAGLTAILAKAGVRNTPSSLATALRTVVVLVGALAMVAIVGSAPTVGTISGHSWLFLILSGMATGASWLCFFKAVQMGPVSTVSAIDKSSIVLTVLLAILLLHETDDLVARLVGIALIGAGTLLMIEWNPDRQTEATAATAGPSWIVYGAGSAVFAALTAILGKVGIVGVESNLGTAIRTVVVLAMAWLVVAVRNEFGAISDIPKKELGFIGLSGLATGASWLFYWRAMQEGPASVVVPIDKLSIVVTVVLAWIFFKEHQSKKALAGLALIVIGTLVMIIPVAR